MVCTFFGHKNTSRETEVHLRAALIDLIENKNFDTFLVGNNGSFDFMVKSNLEFLKHRYPHIKYLVVPAYFPKENNHFDNEYFEHTIYQHQGNIIPPKLAILKRNEWMIEKANYVIAYVKNDI